MNTPKILSVFCISLLAIMACNLPSLVALPTEVAPADHAPDQQLEATAFPSSPPPMPAEATAILSSTPQTSKIVLIGYQSLALGEAANSIQDQGEFEVSVNEIVPSADLLLFTINAPDGPMPDTVRQITNQQGQTISRAAILLINTDLQLDAELEQLVLLEVREMLYRFIAEDQVNRLEVLKMPDLDLGDKLRALLILPPANIQINAPTQ